VQRLSAVVFYGLCACILSACAAMSGPRTVNLSEAQLSRLMDERMNKALSFLKIFDITLSNPKVALDPANGRVITSLDAAMKNPFSGNRLTGAAKISGKLNFDAATNSVVLADTRAEQFKLDNMPSQYASQVNAIGKMVASEFMRDFTLYTLKPEDLQAGGVNYTPGKFEVLSNALAITLNPAR
jgi:hypothetical protein